MGDAWRAAHHCADERQQDQALMISTLVNTISVLLLEPTPHCPDEMLESVAVPTVVPFTEKLKFEPIAMTLRLFVAPLPVLMALFAVKF